MRLAIASLSVGAAYAAQNSTFHNPILPGFHPDPSCIYVPEWNETFFCASSSFNAFPGIPIHASKDLQNWKLIGMETFPIQKAFRYCGCLFVLKLPCEQEMCSIVKNSFHNWRIPQARPGKHFFFFFSFSFVFSCSYVG